MLVVFGDKLYLPVICWRGRFPSSIWKIFEFYNVNWHSTMVAYLPEAGENPFEADKRISAEAFFPVKEQKLCFKNLEGEEGTFFEKRLYSDLPCGATLELTRRFGILDIDRRNVICCVTYDNDEPIKNVDAVDIAQQHVIPDVFKGEGTQRQEPDEEMITRRYGEDILPQRAQRGAHGRAVAPRPPHTHDAIWRHYITH